MSEEKTAYCVRGSYGRCALVGRGFTWFCGGVGRLESEQISGEVGAGTSRVRSERFCLTLDARSSLRRGEVIGFG